MPIKFEHVSHIYSDGTPFRFVALEDTNVTFRDGGFSASVMTDDRRVGSFFHGKRHLLDRILFLIIRKRQIFYFNSFHGFPQNLTHYTNVLPNYKHIPLQ